MHRQNAGTTNVLRVGLIKLLVRSVRKMLNLRCWWGRQSSWKWRQMFCEIGTNISAKLTVFVFRWGNTFKMEPASSAVSCPQKPRTSILLVLSVAIPSEGFVFGTDMMHWGSTVNLTELREPERRLCPVTATGRCSLSWSSYHESGGGGRGGNPKTEF